MSFANNHGIRIHYEIEGQGPPLVMQYGQYFPLEAWRYLNYVGALKDHCRLILLDARGHGESDKPYDPAAYRNEHLVKDILAVMDDLGIEKAHFMGYSSGSYYGLGIAKYAPNRLLSLILGGIAPYSDSANDGSWDLGQITELEKQTGAEFAEKLEEIIQSLGFPPFTPALRTAMQRHDPRALIAWHRCNMEMRCRSYEHLLPAIRVPCLIYSGDSASEFADAQKTAQDIPRAVFVGIPGGGHLEGGTWIHILKPYILNLLGVDK